MYSYRGTKLSSSDPLCSTLLIKKLDKVIQSTSTRILNDTSQIIMNDKYVLQCTNIHSFLLVFREKLDCREPTNIITA